MIYCTGMFSLPDHTFGLMARNAGVQCFSFTGFANISTAGLKVDEKHPLLRFCTFYVAVFKSEIIVESSGWLNIVKETLTTFDLRLTSSESSCLSQQPQIETRERRREPSAEMTRSHHLTDRRTLESALSFLVVCFFLTGQR